MKKESKDDRERNTNFVKHILNTNLKFFPCKTEHNIEQMPQLEVTQFRNHHTKEIFSSKKRNKAKGLLYYS